jgi:hypothetical protein
MSSAQKRQADIKSFFSASKRQQLSHETTRNVLAEKEQTIKKNTIHDNEI